MDEMSSVEFRKRYTRLTKATRVTALGRPVGTWIPSVVSAAWGDRPIMALPSIETENENARRWADGILPVPPVHVAPLPAPRPFTPAPKPGKR